MNNQDSHNIPYDPERKRRVSFAALSGFIAGTIATFITSYINIWRFPELPLHLEWSSILTTWILLAVLGGILAGVAAFTLEGWKSILISAAGMAFTLLLLSSMQSSEGTLLKIVAIVGLLFPIAAMVAPLAAIFFWLAHRFMQATASKGWTRFKIIFVNCIVIVVLGILPGLYAKMSSRAEQGVRLIHGILQDAAKAPASEALHKALSKTKGFPAHKNQPYTLSQTQSTYSTVGVDITVHYDDGYTMICTVVLYPGSNPSIYPCKGQLP
jgi:MFS family permease